MGFQPNHRLLSEARDAAHPPRMFRESPLDRARRWALGTVWALKPNRIGDLPLLGQMWAGDLLSRDATVPDPALARGPNGLCGIARDLSVPALVAAHRRGLYPFAHIGPQKWWTPAERCVLSFEDFHMSKRLRARLRQDRFRVTFDREFEGVIKACAGRRDGKWHLTWITPTMMRAYCDLHDAGFAHSFEVWNSDGTLVGGGYGVAVGGAFTIESQFTRESHTSKIGFAVLNWHLAKWGFILNDNKGPTRNTLEMGFEMVPRAAFQQRLVQAMRIPDRCGRWEVEADLPMVAQWQPPVDSREAPLQPAQVNYVHVGTARVGAILMPVAGLCSERLALAETVITLL